MIEFRRQFLTQALCVESAVVSVVVAAAAAVVFVLFVFVVASHLISFYRFAMRDSKTVA